MCLSFAFISAVKDDFSVYEKNVDVHKHFTRTSHDIFSRRTRLENVVKCCHVSGIKDFKKVPRNVTSLPGKKLENVGKKWLLLSAVYNLSEFVEASPCQELSPNCSTNT